MPSLSDDAVSRLRALVGDASFTARFAIEREIGAGGMGRVFAATEQPSGRRIAVKLLDAAHAGDPARFAAEAELLESLDHPAIVSYVAHGLTGDGRAYLAMAWLDGETVAARLARASLSIADAVAVATRVTDALVYLHGRGIVHRDIKPSNVFLVGAAAERAVVIDLGIAKQLGATGVTATGQLIGTPGYMAPEQVMGKPEVDGRVDLFALGCLMHEMLTGAPPFPGEAVMEVLARLLLHDPTPVAELRPEVPIRIATLVAALMAKRPEDRPTDAAAVAAELAAITRAMSTGNTDELATSPLPRPRGRFRRRLAIAIGAAVVVAAGGAIALAVALRDERPRPVHGALEPPGGLDGTYAGTLERWARVIAPPGDAKHEILALTATIAESPPGELSVALPSSLGTCTLRARRDALHAAVTGMTCTAPGQWMIGATTGTLEFLPPRNDRGVGLILRVTIPITGTLPATADHPPDLPIDSPPELPVEMELVYAFQAMRS